MDTSTKSKFHEEKYIFQKITTQKIFKISKKVKKKKENSKYKKSSFLDAVT